MPAESLAFQGALAHQVERDLALADRPHAVVHAPRTKPLLCQPEAFSLCSEQIGDGNPDILEYQFAMPFGRMMAHDRNVTNDPPSGVFIGTRTIECRASEPGSEDAPVTPITIASRQFG